MPVVAGAYERALAYFAEQDRLVCGECVENRGGEGDSDVDDNDMEVQTENLGSDEVIFFIYIFFFQFQNITDMPSKWIRIIKKKKFSGGGLFPEGFCVVHSTTPIQSLRNG